MKVSVNKIKKALFMILILDYGKLLLYWSHLILIEYFVNILTVHNCIRMLKIRLLL